MKGHMDQILDYMKCPMLYRFRNVDAINPIIMNKGTDKEHYNDNSMYELFDQEVHKVAYHIFNYIQDNKYPSVKILRQKWSRTWCKNKTKQDIMFEDINIRRTTIGRKLEKKGIKAIDHMHTKFKENPGTPLLVGQHTKVKIGKHELDVVIDLVREVEVEGQKILEIIDFKTAVEERYNFNAMPMKIHIHNDLYMTAVSMAFEQLTGYKEHRIMYYDMLNNKEYITKRTEKDKQTLEAILDQVEHAIKNEIYYPVMNYQCNYCPFQKICNQRNWYDDKGGEQNA